jgi:hypothetical protein
MFRRSMTPPTNAFQALDGAAEVSDDSILRVAADVARATVTLSNGRRERLTFFSHPSHPGVMLAALAYPRDLDIHRIDLLDASREPLPDRT